MFLYFNQNIDSDSISDTINNNYIITGIGAIGSGSTGEYNSSIFYRDKISLNNNGTASTPLSLIIIKKIFLSKNILEYNYIKKREKGSR